MVSLDVLTLVAPVIEALQSVSNASEEVYANMASCYSLLIKELDLGLSTANENKLSSVDNKELKETIAAKQTSLLLHNDALTKFHSENSSLIEEIRMQQNSLVKLRESIAAIREDSVLMEIISLNAMIAAVKAGEHGRAFSCITAELKALSSQTIHLSDTIAHSEAEINTVFTEFLKSLTDSMSQKKQLDQDFVKESQTIFENLAKGIDELASGLETIRNKTLEVKNPIIQIMIEIQNQDRIRQSIDHVLLSLKELSESNEEDNDESSLDQLSLLELVPELSKLVLTEIQDNIRSNCQSFKSSLKLARSHVQALETEHNAFLEAQWQATNKESLEFSFQSNQDLVSKYLKENDKQLRLKEAEQRKSTVLQDSLSTLVASLSIFDELLAQYQNIDLASRIQVARQRALQGMQNKATEMTALTEKIKQDADSAIQSTSQFFNAISKLFLDYRKEFSSQLNYERKFCLVLASTSQELKAAKDQVIASVGQNKIFTTAFSQQFDTTETDLERLNNLIETIESQKSLLEALQSQVSAKKAIILEKLGLNEWKVKSDKLKSMIEGFTIFTHKKIAAKLGDFELEASVDAGEATLF